MTQKKNRIEEALYIRGLKQVDLSDMTGILKSTISNWCSQKYQPKQSSLVLMSKALNVSELWLAGYDVPMERVNDNRSKSDERLVAIMEKLIKLKADQIDLVEKIVDQMGGI